uniref:Uncharacterized protein n=1 Tax=Haemonchus placei TaxID=6290 RepID=A0A0N4VTG4_HAEPC
LSESHVKLSWRTAIERLDLQPDRLDRQQSRIRAEHRETTSRVRLLHRLFRHLKTWNLHHRHRMNERMWNGGSDGIPRRRLRRHRHFVSWPSDF